MIKLFDDYTIDWVTIKANHLKEFKGQCLDGLKKVDSSKLDFWESLWLIKLIRDIDKILIGIPDELRVLRNCFISLDLTLTTKNHLGEDIDTYFHSELKRIFNPIDFTRKYQPYWGAYKFIELLGVKSCLYCNRNYTVVYDRDYEDEKGKRGKVRPVLDHLFMKSKYPFFALSLFNLIPCCYECNSSLKGSWIQTNDEDHLNPFSESFHNLYKFNDELNVDINSGINWDTFDFNSFTIMLKPTDEKKTDLNYKRAERNIEIFALKELYNCHKEIITPIIFNSNMYGYGRINDLQEKVEMLKFEPEELKRLVFGNVLFNLNFIKKVPFSKITLDIASKYNVI